ncbi:ABC transporter transmembrane domain-containing protein [Yoonia sp. SS1-5]|uniref:ABC transporter transmembrane domain-containing protein n=1 Tax=Yoonia rhodophyticola TaxID=3137370 RepID=A0AAN0NL34_9RHOB
MKLQEDMRRLRRNPHIVAGSLAINLLGLALPLMMIQIYDRIIPRQGYETLTVLMLGLFGAALAEFCLRVARGHLVALASVRFESFAYTTAYQRLLQFGSLQDSIDQGTQHDRMESINRVRQHHGSDAATALLDIPFIAIFVTVMTLISPVMGAAICAFAAISLCIVWIQRRKILRDSLERQDRDRRRHSFLMETLEGIEMIKGLGIEPLMQRRYEKLMSVSAFMTHQISGRINFSQGVTAAIGLMAPVFMSGIGSVLVISGQMSIGGLAATVLLTGRVIQPTLRIEALLAGERDTRRSEQDVNDLLLTPMVHTGEMVIPRVDEIALDDVSLAPGNDGKYVFRNATARLRRGDCVLLAGNEGAGRSLLLALLAGHVAPTDGTVRINDIPLPDIHSAILADRIALLSADHTLLEGTLLENMTAFEPAKYSDAAFALASELGIREFILQHSDGLSLRVAARTETSLPKSIHDGILLISGLVRSPDIILFDEANAGLDRATDLRMIEILRQRIPDAITVMVTHRPSYMALANRTFTLNDGVLREKTLTASPPKARVAS